MAIFSCSTVVGNLTTIKTALDVRWQYDYCTLCLDNVYVPNPITEVKLIHPPIGSNCGNVQLDSNLISSEPQGGWTMCQNEDISKLEANLVPKLSHSLLD